jgi:hypothetical protein
MPPLAGLLLVLVLSPLLMLVAHAVVFRVLDRAGVGPTAHSSAFVALAVTLVPVLLIAWRLGVFDLSEGTKAAVCGLAYVTMVYGALAVLYVDVVNIAETSLHMHLLLELAWGGTIPLADLLERYGAERMIAARLDRLSSLGQIRIVDGRCHIANRSTLRLARAIDAWRLVLGLPTRPPAKEVEPSTVVKYEVRRTK